MLDDVQTTAGEHEDSCVCLKAYLYLDTLDLNNNRGIAEHFQRLKRILQLKEKHTTSKYPFANQWYINKESIQKLINIFIQSMIKYTQLTSIQLLVRQKCTNCCLPWILQYTLQGIKEVNKGCWLVTGLVTAHYSCNKWQVTSWQSWTLSLKLIFTRHCTNTYPHTWSRLGKWRFPGHVFCSSRTRRCSVRHFWIWFENTVEFINSQKINKIS